MTNSVPKTKEFSFECSRKVKRELKPQQTLLPYDLFKGWRHKADLLNKLTLRQEKVHIHRAAETIVAINKQR